MKRELGTAQAPVDTVTQIIFLGSVHYWTVLPLQTVLFGVPASSFDPSKHVRRIYFVHCSWGCLLCLRHTKTIQFRERELNVILPQVNGDLCPATVIQAYLYLTTGADLLRTLLLTGTASAFTYFILRQKLHSVLTRAGLDESIIKGNSFRGGGATWLSHIGVPVEQSKVIGYWFRDAVHRYIDPHFLNY